MREAKCDLPNKSLSKRRAKLSEEEKAKRLKEMTQNVTWRNQLTKKSVKRYGEEVNKK